MLLPKIHKLPFLSLFLVVIQKKHCCSRYIRNFRVLEYSSKENKTKGRFTLMNLPFYQIESIFIIFHSPSLFFSNINEYLMSVKTYSFCTYPVLPLIVDIFIYSSFCTFSGIKLLPFHSILHIKLVILALVQLKFSFYSQ